MDSEFLEILNQIIDLHREQTQQTFTLIKMSEERAAETHRIVSDLAEVTKSFEESLSKLINTFANEVKELHKTRVEYNKNSEKFFNMAQEAHERYIEEKELSKRLLDALMESKLTSNHIVVQ